MAVVRNLMIRAGADFSGMNKSMQKAQKDLAGFKENVSRTMQGIGTALAGIGLTLGIGSAIKDAMQFEAALGQINRMMGSSAKEFQNWANESAVAFGLSRSEAVRFGATYANLLSGFSAGTEETMKRTQDLLKASAIVASGSGRDIQDVMERIRSGLLGETDAIEDLGLNVNVALIETTKAFKDFANGKSWEQLSFNTQQTIRYFAILEQASTKYGLELAQNTTSRQGAFVAQLKNTQLALGQAFLPIYNAILPALTKLATALAYAMNIVAQFSQALFGKPQEQAKATDAQAEAVNNLAGAYDDAGKKAKGALAGFDEINQLADSAGAGSGAGSGATAPNAELDMPDMSGISEKAAEVSQKVQEMADKVKKAFREMSSFVLEHKELILAALAGLALGFATFLIASNWTAIITGIRGAFVALGAAIGAISWPIALAAAAVAGLIAAFVYFYRTNETFRGVVDGILRAIGEAAVWLWNNVLVPFGKWLGDVFVLAWQGLTVALQWLWKNVLVPLGQFLGDVFVLAWEAVAASAKWLWKNVLTPFGEFLGWLWDNVLVPLSSVLVDVLGVAFQFVADVAKSLWEKVLVPLGDFLKDMLKPTVEAISAVFTFLWEKVLSPFASFIEKTMKVVFEALTATIKFLWEKVLKPLVTFVGGEMKSVFNTVFEGIGDLIKGLKKTLTGVMEFITGVFTGDWETAWNGVKKIFEGVFDSLYAIVKTPLNLIIDAINKVISGLNKISIDIPDIPGVPGRGTTFGINIPKIPHLAKGGITNGPMMAVIGDNPGGQEVVSPLDDLLGMVMSAVTTAIQLTGGGQTGQSGDIVLMMDTTEVARVINPALQREQQRIGSSLIIQPI